MAYGIREKNTGDVRMRINEKHVERMRSGEHRHKEVLRKAAAEAVKGFKINSCAPSTRRTLGDKLATSCRKKMKK